MATLMRHLSPNRIFRIACAVLAILTLTGSVLLVGAAPPGELGRKDRSKLEEPVYRVAATLNAEILRAQPGEHPLAPTIRMAKHFLKGIEENIDDYSCRLVKRERINGVLGERQFIFSKIRHKPFSVYMYFVGPEDVKGREVIFVEGRNNGHLFAHEGSGFKSKFGTVSLRPDGFLAMQGQRYPITDVGLYNLTRRLIEVAEHDAQFGECEVQFFKDAVIKGGKEPRKCTCVQVTHPVPRKEFTFHVARVFFDDELNIPIRYASYAWPTKEGGNMDLIEEYTYLDVELNVGHDDADFDTENPDYNF